jgi:DNA polymerase III delta prime subunit
MELKINEREKLWVERYRPQTIEDCILPKGLREAFQGFVTKGDMPSIILAGGAGTGKTTAAKALCNELGYDWIIINASNDRNIDILRGTITQFASSASLMSDTKVVIMDEADYANPQTLQPALRGAIEEFSKTTRFIFTCNYPHRIIEPLHSRCSVFTYDVPNDEKLMLAGAFMKRAFAILENEGIEFDKKTVAELIKKHFPDYRRILNELQRYSSINGRIDEGVLKSAKQYNVKELVGYLTQKDFRGMRKWAVENIADKDVNSVFRDIYDGMYEYMEPSSVPLAVLTIAKYQLQGMSCPDPEINFAAFCVELMSDIDWK